MGAPGRYTRICEDCGVVMENVGATRRFCPACLAKRSAEKARNAERAKAGRMEGMGGSEES